VYSDPSGFHGQARGAMKEGARGVCELAIVQCTVQYYAQGSGWIP
jgi:hypothetical protein